MIRQCMALMSPAGARARLSVLIFHRVLPEPDPLFPDEIHARQFDTMCAWFRDWLQVLPLDEAVARLQAGTLPARAACITFDDGYADNHDIAMPILQRHGLTATFFVATGYLDGGCMWNDVLIESVRRTRNAVWDLSNLLGDDLRAVPVATISDKQHAIQGLIDRIKYLPVQQRSRLCADIAERVGVPVLADLMMRSEQVRAMDRGGMLVGAHTVSHPILARLGRDEAAHEILRSKQALENLLQKPVRTFAYPNGKPGTDYLPETVDIVRSLGFDAAVSTRWASSHGGTDVFQIPRFTPWDRSRLYFGARLMANLRHN